MRSTFSTRLRHLEAQRPSSAEDPPYVPLMPPASWWAELWELIEASL
jgi:hypothetical protein